MATTADFRNGLCIEFNDQLFQIVQFQHVKPGKGPAFVRTKLKNLKNGRVIENTFSAGVRVNTVRIERRPYQYLYKDEAGFNFMHAETFEQISIDEALVDNADLLKEGMIVEVMIHAESETPLTVELPPFIDLEVTYAEPAEKGNTASSNAQKAVTVETGATIYVPLFVNQGDIIKVDSRDRSYSERVKK
jgi:elongation factor P